MVQFCFLSSCNKDGLPARRVNDGGGLVLLFLGLLLSIFDWLSLVERVGQLDLRARLRRAARTICMGGAINAGISWRLRGIR